MDAGVLDEPDVRVHAAANDAGEIETLYVGLHGSRVIEGQEVLIFGEPDAGLAEKFKIGLIARQCNYIIIFYSLDPIGCEDIHFIRPDGLEGGMGVGFYAAFLYPVLDVGFYPVFYPAADAFAADDHRYLCTFTPGFQGGIHR